MPADTYKINVEVLAVRWDGEELSLEVTFPDRETPPGVRYDMKWPGLTSGLLEAAKRENINHIALLLDTWGKSAEVKFVGRGLAEYEHWRTGEWPDAR